MYSKKFIKIGAFWIRIAKHKQIFENKTVNLRKCLTKFSRIVECGAVDSKGANVRTSCRSRQELSSEYLLFTCKIWRRYSRERASRSLPKNSQKLEKKLENFKTYF